MSTGISVRLFSRVYVAKVRSLVIESTQCWGGSWTPFIASLYSKNFVPDKNTFRYVVLKNNEVIGTFILKHEVDVCVIYFLAIRREFRGMGIGSHLLKFAEEFAKKRKLPILRVDAAHELKRNLHFYLSRGFKKSGIALNLYMPGDKQVFFYKQVGE